MLNGIAHHGCIEVYLPKKLQNQGALIGLLAQVLEFDAAKYQMVKDAERAFRDESPLFDLRDDVVPELREGDVSGGLRQLYEAEGYPLPRDARLVVDESREASFWVECEFIPGMGWRKAGRICATDCKALQISPWRRQFPTLDLFIERMERMENRIVGYSIYEVDGAFAESDKGQLVPVVVGEVEKSEEHEHWLVNGDIGKIAALLAGFGEEVGDPLFMLDVRLSSEKTSMEQLNEMAGALVGRKDVPESSVEERYHVKDGELGKVSHAVVKCRAADGAQSTIQDVKYIIVNTEDGAAAQCRIVKQKPDDGANTGIRYEITTGNRAFRFERRAFDIQISRLIPIVEERTLVLRFLIDLRLDSEGAPVFSASQSAKDEADDPYTRAHDIIWDAMTLIGQYFVRHLDRVGIEDEIWISLGLGYLWRWKHGEVFARKIEETAASQAWVPFPAAGRGQS